MDSKGTHFVFDVALFYYTFIESHSPAVNCRDVPNAEVTSRQFAFKQAETTEPLPAATASLLYLMFENCTVIQAACSRNYGVRRLQPGFEDAGEASRSVALPTGYTRMLRVRKFVTADRSKRDDEHQTYE